MDAGAVDSQSSFLLNNQSIVNINGVHARLEIDPDSGNIKVIPLPENCTPADHGVGGNDPNQDDQLVKPLHHGETDASLAENLQHFHHTLLCTDPQEPQDCSLQNPQGLSGTSTEELHSIPEVSDARKLIEEHISDHKTQSLFDTNPPGSKTHSLFDASSSAIPVARLEDLTNPNDSMEPDLLEQLLSSVARDLQFINSTSTLSENSAANILEPSLIPPPNKDDFGFATCTGASEPQSPDTTETVFQENAPSGLESSLNHQSEIPFTDKDGHYESWDLSSDAIDSSTLNRRQLILPSTSSPHLEVNNSLSITQEKIFLPNRLVFGNERAKTSILPRNKQKLVPRFKSIRPKPAAPSFIMLTLPIGAPINTPVPALALTNPENIPLTTQRSSTQVEIFSGLTEHQLSFNQKQNETTLIQLDSTNASSIIQDPNVKTIQSTNNSHNPDIFSEELHDTPTVEKWNIDSESESLTLSSFSCPVCHNSFLCQSKEDFQSHLLTHPNLCSLCEIHFEKELDFFGHLKDHDVALVTDEQGGVELKCLMCGELYLHASNMQRHILRHILNDLKTPDSSLKPEVSISAKVSTHKQIPEGKKVVCHQCGKLLKAKSLTAHINNHCPANNPDKNTSPVQCKECRNLFLNMMTYKRHLQHSCRVQNQPASNRNTSGSTTTTCDQCFKPVSTSSLNTHKSQYCSAVTPAKQVCKYCGVVLKHKHSLRNHVKWHCKKSPTATNPMKCLCNKIFRNYKAFQSHYQNHCVGRDGEVNDA